MASKEKAAEAERADRSNSSSRADKLLAVLVLEAISKKSDQEKAVLLNAVGFKNPEIATLLRTTPHTVSQHLSASRAKKTKKPAAKHSSGIKKRR